MCHLKSFGRATHSLASKHKLVLPMLCADASRLCLHWHQLKLFSLGSAPSWANKPKRQSMLTEAWHCTDVAAQLLVSWEHGQSQPTPACQRPYRHTFQGYRCPPLPLSKKTKNWTSLPALCCCRLLVESLQCHVPTLPLHMSRLGPLLSCKRGKQAQTCHNLKKISGS